jgi:hypothetical protein
MRSTVSARRTKTALRDVCQSRSDSICTFWTGAGDCSHLQTKISLGANLLRLGSRGWADVSCHAGFAIRHP